MSRAVLQCFVALALSAMCPRAPAETVSIRLDMSPVGQGYVFRLESGCYAATPKHVLELVGSDSLAQPLMRGRDGREGQGVDPVVPDRTIDLALVRVEGPLSNPCGTLENLGPRNAEYIIMQSRELDLVFWGSAELAHESVTLMRENPPIVVIVPARAKARLAKGMSGGAIYDRDGTPVAMLLLVDTSKNVGRALRFDRIRRLSEQMFSAQQISDNARATMRRGKARVVDWIGFTPSAEAGPAQLLEGRPWTVVTSNRRASVTVAFPSEQTVSRVRISFPSGDRSHMALSSWTVLTRMFESDDWLISKSCPLSPLADANVIDCQFVPRTALQVKIELGTTVVGQTLTLERLDLQ